MRFDNCRIALAGFVLIGTVGAPTAPAQNLDIAFIEGRGADAAVETVAWDTVGIKPTLLKDDAAFTIDNLLKFDVVAVGVVAYDQNETLKKNFENVKDYVRRGGYLVTLEFQQDSTWKPAYMPHPISLLDPDVEDTAGVTLADHPIWKSPHTITEKTHFAPGSWGAGDFSADGPQKVNAPWVPLLTDKTNGWVLVAGAEAGKGYVVFNSLQVLQSLGRDPKRRNVADVMENMLLLRGALAIKPKGKLATTWAAIRQNP
jgi:hypothetical protein